MRREAIMQLRFIALPTLATLALAVGACAQPAPTGGTVGTAPAGPTTVAETPVMAPTTSAAAVATTAGTPVDPSVAFSSAGTRFVPAATVAKAMDDKSADILIVDARPPADYEFGHIPGAINVPYFEPEKHLAQLPKDKWIVAYCECPHAEAEQVANYLEKQGYTQVRVMDEGYQGWKDIGRPTVGGTAVPSQG
jgi:rhodanese-related sulfurtransferase